MLCVTVLFNNDEEGWLLTRCLYRLYFDASGVLSDAQWLWLGIYNMPR